MVPLLISDGVGKRNCLLTPERGREWRQNWILQSQNWFQQKSAGSKLNALEGKIERKTLYILYFSLRTKKSGNSNPLRIEVSDSLRESKSWELVAQHECQSLKFRWVSELRGGSSPPLHRGKDLFHGGSKGCLVPLPGSRHNIMGSEDVWMVISFISKEKDLLLLKDLTSQTIQHPLIVVVSWC